MVNYRQDMPPQGGYGRIDWEKPLAKARIGSRTFWTALSVATVASWALFYYERNKKRKLWLEMNDGRLALEPLLIAEQNRAYLRRLRQNRDEEAEIMKNVEGWKVGTWYGEPVYHNQGKRFPLVHLEDYYMHNTGYQFYKRRFELHRH